MLAQDKGTDVQRLLHEVPDKETTYEEGPVTLQRDSYDVRENRYQHGEHH
jgi:hypothetical protein